MGLGKITPDDNENGNGNNSSGGSQASSRTKFKYPQFSIEEDQDGEIVFRSYPKTTPLTYEKSSPKSGWTLERKPARIKKFWMDSMQFNMVKSRVKKHFDEDLVEILREDAARGSELITKAARIKDDVSGQIEARKYRTCPICGKDINVARDDYEEISNKLVCSRHNVRELHDAGLLD